MSGYQTSVSGSGRKVVSGNANHIISTHTPSGTVIRGHAKSNLSGVSNLPSTSVHTHESHVRHVHPAPTSHTHAANSVLTSGVHTHGTQAHITTGTPTHVRYDSTRDYSSANTRHVYSPQTNDLSEMKSSGIRVVYGDKVERYSNPKERGSSHTHASEHSTRVVSNNPLNTRVAGHISYPHTSTTTTATNLKPSSAFKKDDNVTRTYVIGKDGVRHERHTNSEHPGRSQNSNIYSNESQVKYVEKKVEVEKIVYKDKIVEKVVADPKVVEELKESKIKEEKLQDKLENLKNLSEENTEMGHHFASSTTQLMIQIERVKAQNKLIVAGYGHLVGNALLEESFNNLERRYNQLEVKNKGLEAHVQESELRMGSMKSKNDALKEENENHMHRIEHAEESMNDFANEVKALKEQVKELKDEKDELKHQNDKDEKEMMELTRKLSATQSNKDETSDLNDLVKKLTDENQNDKKTMVKLNEHLEEAKEDAKDMLVVIDDLKGQLESNATSPWSGHFEQDGQEMDFNIAELTVSSETIQGKGQDDYGHFSIDGHFSKNGDNSTVNFKKVYTSGESEGATVLYSGVLGSDKMGGKWEVDGNASITGKFRLRKGLPQEAPLKSEEKTSEPAWDNKMGAVTEKKNEEASEEGTPHELSKKLMVANTKLMIANAKAGGSGGGNSGSGQNMSDKMKNLESAIGQNEGAVADLKNIELRYSQLQGLYENTLTQYRGVLSKILK